MKRSSKIFFLFLAIFGLLNLFQAYFTPLHNDEAYYWMYSKYPAWGYFDHPPMIAAFIKAGYTLFSNTLGVRLVTVISLVVCLYVIWKLLESEKKQDAKNVMTLILVILVLPVMNIYGFFASPDSPLLLFTVIFLLCYKRFLIDESWINTFVLGITMAGVMYSKYHGAIMLVLIIISNPGLLKKPKFYVAALSGLILFLPHIYWQYANNFPSVRYHLEERASGFKAAGIPEFFLNQFLIHNPFILPVFLLVIFRTKVRDMFERGLKFIVAGFFIFFFIASFRYDVQPQWTALIAVPMIILFFNHADFNPAAINYTRIASLVMIPLFLFARSSLMVDFLPVSFLKKEFHENKSRMEVIRSLAGQRPVVFTNSYQDPSLYTFYTGRFAHSLNNKDYRKTQYDLWPFEEKVHGKEVLYKPHWLDDYYKSKLLLHVTSSDDSIYYRIFSDFQSLQKECVYYDKDSLSFSRSSDNMINLKIFNPYPYPIKLDHPDLPVVFQAGFLNKKGYLEIKKNLELPAGLTTIEPGDTVRVSCFFSIEELPAGDFRFVIMSETGFLYDTFNSKITAVKVKP